MNKTFAAAALLLSTALVMPAIAEAKMKKNAEQVEIMCEGKHGSNERAITRCMAEELYGLKKPKPKPVVAKEEPKVEPVKEEAKKEPEPMPAPEPVAEPAPEPMAAPAAEPAPMDSAGEGMPTPPPSANTTSQLPPDASAPPASPSVIPEISDAPPVVPAPPPAQ